MNVLMLRSNPIDPDPRVEKEAGALAAAGHEVALVGWDRASDHPARPAAPLLLDGFEIPRTLIGARCEYGGGLANLRALLRFERGLLAHLREREDACDCLHACDLDTGLAARLACRGRRTLLVYDIFDYYADARPLAKPLSWALSRLEDGVISSADATIICTEQRRVQLSGTKPKRLTVIENSPSLKSIPAVSREETTRDGVLLAYVGVLQRDRYLERMLDAVERSELLSLHIAGFGVLEDEVRAAAERCPRIIFHGKVPYRKALELEGESDVMTALYDPRVANHRLAAPNKYYESLLLGKPLIAVKGTSVADWAESTGTGCALPDGFSADEFVRAAVAMKQANEGRAITERAQRAFREKLCWEIMAGRLTDLYADLEQEVAR